MSAERMPPTEPSPLARPWGWLTRLVLHFPTATLALAVEGRLLRIGFAALMVVIAVRLVVKQAARS